MGASWKAVQTQGNCSSGLGVHVFILQVVIQHYATRDCSTVVSPFQLAR